VKLVQAIDTVWKQDVVIWKLWHLIFSYILFFLFTQWWSHLKIPTLASAAHKLLQ